MHIILVEDDPHLGEAIHDALTRRAYAVTWLRDGATALEALRGGTADLVLLDLGLPDRDGLDVLEQARHEGSKTPVLVLTARDSVGARIRGLDLGADDYLVKPFHLDELAARIRSITRRAKGMADNRLEVGALKLDLASSEAILRDDTIALSRREFALLKALMERAGRIVRRDTLENAMYGLDNTVEANAIEVQVHWLRRKLGQDTIQTVRGIGYMLRRDIA